MYIFVNDSAYLPFRTDCAKSRLLHPVEIFLQTLTPTIKARSNNSLYR